MKLGLPISTALHAGVLLWALFSFSAKTFDASSESMPIDLVSASEFSQAMAGSQQAPQTAAPKPIVDKVADEVKPAKDPTPKISERPPVEATADASPPPPEPAPTQNDVKPAEPSVDAIAETLQKEQAKQLEEQKRLAEQKRIEEAKKREDAKRRAEAKRIEDAKRREEAKKLEERIATALLDKRDARRDVATGATINQTANLGAPPRGAATSLSQSEYDALRARLDSQWTVYNDCVVVVHIQLGRDRRLTAEPEVVSSSGAGPPQCQAAADSAKRAVLSSQPFDMLLPSTYDVWRDIEVTFDPKELRRG